MEQDPLRPRLLRKVIIDMLPYAVTDEDILMMQERLGLVPSSRDVLELERKESNSRIETTKPVADILNTLAGYSAEAIAEYFLMHIDTDDDEEDDEDGISIEQLRSVLVKQNVNVIVTAAHGIVSHLIASGVLVFRD
jgi:hypothetical protein